METLLIYCGAILFSFCGCLYRIENCKCMQATQVIGKHVLYPVVLCFGESLLHFHYRRPTEIVHDRQHYCGQINSMFNIRNYHKMLQMPY